MAKAAKEKSPKKSYKSGDIPSLLAFERKLEPSDGLMFAGKWEEKEWQPIVPHEMRGLGTHSQLSVAEEKKGETNLVCVDVAGLPMDCDTLKLVFSLRILPLDGVPCGCGKKETHEKIKYYVESLREEKGSEAVFSLLAYRYAWNLVSGRFFWRNRLGAMAEDLKIEIFHNENGKKTKIGVFSGANYSLRNFEPKAEQKTEAFKNLVSIIEATLRGESHSALLEIEAFRRLGAGQPVYPSQEFIDPKGRPEGSNSRVFYKLPYGGKEEGIAGIHSQKIGNALRTIDTWYPKAEEVNHAFPISIEPYGAVPRQKQSFRSEKPSDFYSILKKVLNPENKDKEKMEILTPEEAVFFLAVLIRGGVFGGNEEK